MARYELIAFSTEEHGENAVRFRKFSTSDNEAEAWRMIPRIDFTDSGHGIVFQARRLEAAEKRKPQKNRYGETERYAAQYMVELRKQVRRLRREDPNRARP
jgi:hypothetical protein